MHTAAVGTLDTEECLEQFLGSRADQPGQADDFSAPHVQVDLPIIGDCGRVLAQLIDAWGSRKAADLASIRYREGTVDYLVLLDAERERLTAEDAQALGEVDLYRGIVAIYKALGGGWQTDSVAAAN